MNLSKGICFLPALREGGYLDRGALLMTVLVRPMALLGHVPTSRFCNICKDERERAIRHLSSFRNLVMCGRQGTFRYIFCDTAMEMGRIAARGIINKNIKQHEIFNHRNEKTVIELQSVA